MSAEDPFAPLETRSASPRTGGALWQTITPVPANAPPPPAAHVRLGKPSAIWRYRDASGATNGYVCRFETADGKAFRPLTYARPRDGGQPSWRWEGFPTPRPLYNLHKLAAATDQPVIVTEGEKAADAAGALLKGWVAVTCSNGAKSACKADWAPLRGRRVLIWPDHDEAGRGFAKAVAEELIAVEAASVAIANPPSDAPDGWDAADALAEQWDSRRAEQLVAEAKSVRSGARDDSDASGRRRTPQRDILIGLTDPVEFWHDANRIAFATFPVNSHRENWPVRSREFRMWLAARYYVETGGAIGGQALEDGIRILEARAVHDGEEHETFVRVGLRRGTVYVDLCDPRWRAIEVTRQQWQVVTRPSVKFLRSPSMRPLPEPERGGLIEELRRFVNLPEDQYTLAIAWLVGTFRPRGPYPILVANGEQGSGKSNFCRIIRSLIDPSAAPIRSVPKDDRDLTISAYNSHVLAFDNLSAIPGWLSDALCRMSTGGGFATRTLHSDRDETIFEGQRPILLNGIPALTERADLADRALVVHLRAIPEEDRRPEDELLTAFERARPRILGALFDAVSAGLRHFPTTVVDRPGRMADFEKWVTAASPGLGWVPGAFRAAYHENRRDISESSFEADPIAVAIRDFVVAGFPDGWSGTATELLSALSERAPEKIRSSKIWPATAQSMGNRFDRVRPLLRMKGFTVDRKHSGQRTIIIVPPRPMAA